MATDISEQIAEQLRQAGVDNAELIARQVMKSIDPVYSEVDLRDAFRAGWKERNRNPGLKRQTRRTLNNAVLGAIGGGRFADQEYVPDDRTYHASIWANSAYRKALHQGSELSAKAVAD
jgi:shikimate kinase